MMEGDALLDQIGQDLAAARLAPFLGPGILGAVGGSGIPDSSRALVFALNARIAVPGRVRGNLWEAAQWIETYKHRVTLVRALQALFEARPEPSPFHRWLAGLGSPLIVDGWYDGLMADALVGANRSFAQIQGVRRSGQSREEDWVAVYDENGVRREEAGLEQVGTILYKPHGGIRPAANFLVSDSDYVEVLTEIDIQTPIPEIVTARRASLGFVFLGQRFHDQMQRIFARQIVKRSRGPYYAVIEGALSRNEARFAEQQGIVIIDMPLPRALARLMDAA